MTGQGRLALAAERFPERVQIRRHAERPRAHEWKGGGGLESEQQLAAQRWHRTPEGKVYFPGNSYLPMNNWQAIHILPAGTARLPAVHLFTVGRKQKKEREPDRVIGSAGRRRDFLLLYRPGARKHLGRASRK